MMKINVNETKNIKFSVNVQGIDIRDLKGHIRLIKDDIEYGFPIKTNGEKIEVSIPPLSTIIKEDLSEKDKFEAKLEIIANNTYSSPWADTIVVEVPMKVEASLSKEEDIKEEKNLDISVDSIDEEDIKEDIKMEKKKEIKTRFGKILRSS